MSPERLKLLATIAAAAMVGVFVFLGVGPALHLLARLAPANDVKVEIVGRDGRHGAQPEAGRLALLHDPRTHAVDVRLPEGRVLRIEAPKSLFDRATPGLTRLSEATLRRSVVLGLPVSMTLVSRLPAHLTMVKIAPRTEQVSLLMPLPFTLLGLALCAFVVGYVPWRLWDRPLHWPVVAGSAALALGLGGWAWLPG